jgi:hypothetical protein
LFVEWGHVLGEGGVCLDGLTRLLVDVPGESVALLGRPGLLVAGIGTLSSESDTTVLGVIVVGFGRSPARQMAWYH